MAVLILHRTFRTVLDGLVAQRFYVSQSSNFYLPLYSEYSHQCMPLLFQTRFLQLTNINIVFLLGPSAKSRITTLIFTVDWQGLSLSLIRGY